MNNNQCTCSFEKRELCPVHRKRNLRRDFYKYEDECAAQQYNDEEDETI